MKYIALLLGLCLLISGCGSSSVQVQPEVQAAVEAALVGLQVVGPQQLTPGQTAQYRLSGTFTDGNTYDLSSLATWSSSSTAVATIDADGLGTAVADGTTTVTASVNERSATLSVTVTTTDVTLTQLVVTPENSTVTVGQSQSYQAQGVFSDGTTRDVSGEVTWSTSDSNVASISLLGEARGRLEGNTAVTATLGGISGSTNLMVTPAPIVSLAIAPLSHRVLIGESVAYRATATFTDGTTADVTSQVLWSVSNPNFAVISQGGVALGVGRGVLQVTGTLGAFSASTQLTVSEPVFGVGGGGGGAPPAATGQLFVSANSGDSIRSIGNASTADGLVTPSGSIDDTPSNFLGITMDVGLNILYAVDSAGSRIASFNSPGGTPTARNSLTGLTMPLDVAVGTFNGVNRLFVLRNTRESEQIIVVDGASTANGAFQTNTVRDLGFIFFNGSLCDPRAISYDAGSDRLYVAVANPEAVVVIDNVSTRSDGETLTAGPGIRVITTPGGDDFGLSDPRGLMFEPGTRRLYVADADRGLIVFANADTASGSTASAAVVTGGANPAPPAWEPNDAFIDAGRNQVYVTDRLNNRIMVFNGASGLTGVDDITPLAPARTLTGNALSVAESVFVDLTR